MNKINYLFSLILFTLVLTACSETEEVGKFDNWRARNEAFMDSIATVYNSTANKNLPESNLDKLYAFKDPTNNEMLYVKKIIKGEGTVNPKFTSTVQTLYRLSYINGDVKQENYSGKEPSEFDAPTEFGLNEVISGWTYTLDHMVAGDLWTLYIPYQSAYGSTTGSNGDLEPYSALIYQVKLVKIVE